MSFLPRTAQKNTDHTALYAIMIALPLTLAGTAFLTFLMDAGSRVGL
jgi:hypothetical protein